MNEYDENNDAREKATTKTLWWWVTTVAARYLSQPHFEGSVRLPFTFSKMGLGSPPRLLKTQSSIAGVKTPRIEVFIIPLEKSRSVNV
jgi:hypothetical protein